MTNKPQLPKDVEEFIASESCYDPEHPKSSEHDYILVDDLRTWMAGHVRVPVGVAADAERYQWIKNNVTETLTKASLVGEFSEHKCEFVFPKLISWAIFCGAIPLNEAIDSEIKSLNASKGEL